MKLFIWSLVSDTHPFFFSVALTLEQARQNLKKQDFDDITEACELEPTTVQEIDGKNVGFVNVLALENFYQCEIG